MGKIYVASSWRNAHQPVVVAALRDAGHEVYDFRNPREGDHGFSWSEIDPGWQTWSVPQFRSAIRHPVAEEGFSLDMHGMLWADTCVLLLECGKSAHLEAGWFVGWRDCAQSIASVINGNQLEFKNDAEVQITRRRAFAYLPDGLLGGISGAELMYKMLDGITDQFDELLQFLSPRF